MAIVKKANSKDLKKMWDLLILSLDIEERCAQWKSFSVLYFSYIEILTMFRDWIGSACVEMRFRLELYSRIDIDRRIWDSTSFPFVQCGATGPKRTQGK